MEQRERGQRELKLALRSATCRSRAIWPGKSACQMLNLKRLISVDKAEYMRTNCKCVREPYPS